MMTKRIFTISLFLLFCIIKNDLYSLEFDLTGKVESKRKGNFITLLFMHMPDKENYLIIENDLVIGKIKILSVSEYSKNQRITYRALAEYSLMNGSPEILKAGTVIGLVREEKKEEREYGERKYVEKTIYKKSIKADPDNREMILIPEGKFVYGSNAGDKDEEPQQIIYLDSYYIDKYEVSNADYSDYLNETNSPPPASWTHGKYNQGEDDFPVLVSYFEAAEYAGWAGKRLPTEEEWEKAARGTGLEKKKKQDETYITIETPVLYPWGNKFEPSRANSMEFWEIQNIGQDIKKKYSKGMLPIHTFKGIGDSIYGIVNMSGNAAEWTSTWYNSYKGSKYTDKRYGTQVKVIKGGAWFNSKYKLRTSDREIGGLPNLHEDNIAGFRCVKEPTIMDEIK